MSVTERDTIAPPGTPRPVPVHFQAPRPPREVTLWSFGWIAVGVVLGEGAAGLLASYWPGLGRAIASLIAAAALIGLCMSVRRLVLAVQDLHRLLPPAGALPEKPEARIEALGIAPPSTVPVFVVLLVAVLILFSSFVMAVSVPDYLLAKPAPRPAIEHLAQLDPQDGILTRVAELAGASFYYCSVTLATVGYGDIRPSTAFWGRFCSFLMMLTALVGVPLTGKYVIDNSALAHSPYLVERKSLR
jgi:MFS family permease